MCLQCHDQDFSAAPGKDKRQIAVLYQRGPLVAIERAGSCCDTTVGSTVASGCRGAAAPALHYPVAVALAAVRGPGGRGAGRLAPGSGAGAGTDAGTGAGPAPGLRRRARPLASDTRPRAQSVWLPGYWSAAGGSPAAVPAAASLASAAVPLLPAALSSFSAPLSHSPLSTWPEA
jgi:hypothetical protein